MTRRGWVAAALMLAFIACVGAANAATARWGQVPVGFGLYATAGTYFAGLAFLLRDLVHDVAGRAAVLCAILAGALLSLGVAPAALALASFVAFAVSELADFAVYAPLRQRGFTRAALASNVVGAVVDTLLFLWLAAPALRLFNPSFDPWASAPGQLVGKLLLTSLVVIAVAVLRQPRRRASTVGDA